MPRYEFSEGSSNKFWEIERTGNMFKCRFGKLGANGQTTLKKFGSESEAKLAYEKLVAEKTKKGYRPANGGGSKSAASAAAKPSAKAAAPAATKGAAKPSAKAAAPAATKGAAKPSAKAAAPAATRAAPALSSSKTPDEAARDESGNGQYFELRDGSSSKFWEITLEGRAFTTRFGKIGTNGQSSTKSYKTDGEARAEYDKLVAEKRKKGYALKRGDAPAAAVSVHARNAQLESAVEEQPDRPDAYLVLADWLQSEGDPRGELIVLHHAGKTAEATKLITRNKDHFWGKAAELTDILQAHPYRPRGKNTTWRWGYLESLWISNKHDRDRAFGEGDGTKPEVDSDEALGWLLDHPSTRFLRELTVGIVTFEDNGYDGTASVIGARSLPTLRKLLLGDFISEETELNWSDAGNLEPLYKAVPNLESLTVRSGRMMLGAIDLPKLKELVVITGGFDKVSLGNVCSAKWPALERLSLQIGRGSRGAEIKVADLRPIFDAKVFPCVTHLGLGNALISDAICEALATSAIAAQLESLDLSQGTLGDAGAEALASGRFPKLGHINASESYLTKKGIATLKGIAKKVDADSQQDDEGEADNRYISAYE